MSLIPTSLSPLQLKSHSFAVVSVRANPNGKPTGGTALDQQVFCLPVPETPNHWNLQLKLALRSVDQSNPFCYEFEIVAIGVVELTGDFPPEKREAIAAVNGLGILYSACREMLLNVTARSVYGPFNIPSLNFAKVIEEAKANMPVVQNQPEAVKV
jgi:preprotein translocase subunit SecB